MKILRAIGFFCTTLVIYLAIPLLGWGLDDLAGFFASLPRLAYTGLVLALGAAAGYQAYSTPEGIRGGGAGLPGKRQSRQAVVRVIIVAAMYVALLGLPYLDRHALAVLPDLDALRWAGAALVAFGWFWIVWSGYALGRFYSADVTLQKDHRLITRGPYAHIRHPRYLGAIAFGFGMALLFRTWIGLAGALVFAGVIAFRIADEELFMQREFGAEWAAYTSRTWRMIPYLF